MRNTLFILISTIFLLVACGQKEEVTAPEEVEVIEAEPIAPIDFDFDKIKERGYLTAAVDYSSTSYFIYKGELLGFEYELLKSLENYYGVKVNIVVQSSITAAFEQLNKGEIDLIASPLTITKKRKEKVAFTESYVTLRQMLVQRKPDNWRNMKLHEIEKKLIRNQVDLIDKDIHVLNASSYIGALAALSTQIGGDINIVEAEPGIDTEELIQGVVNGEFALTVADENMARVNHAYHPNLDVETPISFPRRIAWAVRINATQLRDTLSWGFRNLNHTARFNNLYNKYFKSTRKAREMAKSEYTSFSGTMLSPYDDLIKENAARVGWDWHLLASMVYQESKFEPASKSWVGAQGLLQMMPATAKEYGVTDRSNPAQSLKGGTDYLIWLEKYWRKSIPDPDELGKFVMSSYNVGLGHVIDARALTRKFGGDDEKWVDVRVNLLKLSNKQYYQDPVVKLGYARGSEPVNYVDEILDRYERYKQLVPD